MRILHVANFSWISASRRKRLDDMARYYSTDRKISNGLARLGHNVWDFSYRDIARALAPLGLGKALGRQRMGAALLEQARRYQPDLLLLGHCELVAADTLAAARAALPACKIAQWWVDVFRDSDIPHLRAKLPHLDAFFATTAPAHYRPLVAAASAPPLHYLPNIVDSSVETQRAFAEAAHDYDLLFAGADDPARAGLLQTLQQVAALREVRAGYFGFGGRRKLAGAEFVATLGRSKMALNLSHASDVPLYSSDRLAQITGNGCLAFTPRTPGMEALFAADEVVYYDDPAALPDLIAGCHRDDAARRRIAEAGWRRAHRSYNEKRIARYLLEAVAGEFSESYEWQNLPAFQ